MTPRSSRHLPPFLHEIGWDKFQRLCCDLLAEEPEISKSSVYGRQGQSQRGIDLLANVRGKGIEVGQCKCEKAFTVSKVRNVSNEFFEDWEYWKSRSIRRFILFVAAELVDSKITDEELAQRKRFKKYGIEYELWDANTITSKLRLHRIIARTYLDSEELVEMVCGSAVETAGTSRGIESLVQSKGVLLSELEGVRGRELDELRELNQAGNHSEALRRVQALRSSDAWVEFMPKLKARALRFEVSVRLNLRQDIDQVERLLADARSFDSSADFQSLDAYLTYLRSGIEVALRQLAHTTSIEARHLRWAMLLEAGRLKELEAEISEPSNFVPDAESYRLEALLAVAQKDIVRARLAISKAFAASPQRHNVRCAKAIVDYYSALSPAFGNLGRLNWPTPAPWTLVKQDSESRLALESSAKVFAEEAGLPDCSANERVNLRVWQLACLACSMTRQREAAELAESILKEAPACFGAIVWGLQRGFRFDAKASIRALKAHLVANPDDPEAYLTLWSLLLEAEDLAACEAVIVEAESAFRKTGNEDIWLFHMAQAIAVREGPRNVSTFFERIQNAELRAAVEISIKRNRARTDKNERHALAEILAQDFERTGRGQTLLECCDLKAGLGDYVFVADHGDILVEKIGTAAVLRLVLDASWRSEKFELCLSLIQKYRGVFEEGALTPDIRRLTALCQQRLGDWTGSRREAETLYREHRDLISFFVYFDLLVEIGDARSASVLARDLRTLKGTKPKHLLRAVAVILHHDRDLAIELWRRANRRPIGNKKLATQSMELGFRLGLSEEAQPLLERLTRAARGGKGPLQVKHFGELLEMIRERREVEKKVTELYLKGEIPIHMFSENLNIPLVVLICSQMRRNRMNPNLLGAPVLMLRAGNRSSQHMDPSEIVLDITALIIAEELGILEKISQCVKRLWISPHVTASLNEQISRLTPNQPDRKHAQENFISFVRSGRIQKFSPNRELNFVSEELRDRLGNETCVLLDTAHHEDGFLLADGAFIDCCNPDRPIELPACDGERVLFWSDLERYLQNDFPADHLVKFAKGTTLLVPARLFASFTLQKLEAVLQEFRLMVTFEALDSVEQELEEYRQQERMAQWTQALLDRVLRKVDSGNIKVLPVVSVPQREVGKWGLTSRTIVDMSDVRRGTNSVVWCDDRMINRHFRMGQHPLVGVSEILEFLRTKGTLLDKEFYEAILHLRRGNVRYLPIEEDEIIFHLDHAPIIDGKVKETSELTSLRRYLNTCLLDKDRIHPPTLGPGEKYDLGEFTVLLGIKRAIDDAMLTIWNDASQSFVNRAAKADWLWHNLFFDGLAFRQTFVDPSSPHEAEHSLGQMLARLYEAGIGLDFRTVDDEVSPRLRYFDWVESRVLVPLMRMNGKILLIAGQAITQFITEQVSESSESRKQESFDSMCVLLSWFIHDLPTPLQTELDLPVEVQMSLKVKKWDQSIVLKGRLYDPNLFWQAVADAYNRREGSVIDREGENRVIVRFGQVDDERGVILGLEWETDHTDSDFTEAFLPLLSEDIQERISFLEGRSDWLDVPSETKQLAVAELASIDSPSVRIERSLRWRDESPEIAYERFKILLESKKGISVENLQIPNWERLRIHLRLPDHSDASFTKVIAEAGTTLKKEVGLRATLERLIHLPVKLPAAIEDAWCRLDPDEAKEVYLHLRASAPSIESDIHCARLAGLRNTPDFWIRSAELIESLLDLRGSSDDFGSFRALLRLVDAEYTRSGIVASTQQQLAMIWYHASRLHGLLRKAEGVRSDIKDWIESNTPRWTANSFTPRSNDRIDLTRPAEVTLGRLVFHGLARMVGGLPNAKDALSGRIAVDRLFEGEKAVISQLRLDLLRRSDLWRNTLDSFLERPTDEELVSLFGSVHAQTYFSTFTDEYIAAAVDQLVEEPDVMSHWTVIFGLIHDGVFPPEAKQKFLKVLREIDFAQLGQKFPDEISMIMIFASQQVARSGDEALVVRLEEALLNFARDTGAIPLNQEQNVTQFDWLVNAFYALSLSCDDTLQCSRRFFEYFQRFLTICPQVASSFPNAGMDWLLGLPPQFQTSIWRFILTCRVLA